MPLFEWECPQCGKTIELLVKFAEKQYEVICPHCGSEMDLIPYSKPAPMRWGKSGGWNK